MIYDVIFRLDLAMEVTFGRDDTLPSPFPVILFLVLPLPLLLDKDLACRLFSLPSHNHLATTHVNGGRQCKIKVRRTRLGQHCWPRRTCRSSRCRCQHQGGTVDAFHHNRESVGGACRPQLPSSLRGGVLVGAGPGGCAIA